MGSTGTYTTRGYSPHATLSRRSAMPPRHWCRVVVVSLFAVAMALEQPPGRASRTSRAICPRERSSSAFSSPQGFRKRARSPQPSGLTSGVVHHSPQNSVAFVAAFRAGDVNLIIHNHHTIMFTIMIMTEAGASFGRKPPGGADPRTEQPVRHSRAPTQEPSSP